MKKYIKVRKEILGNIKKMIILLNEKGYITDELYNKFANKKVYRKKDFFSLLSDFDLIYYGSLYDDHNLYKNMHVYGKSQLGKDLIAFTINDNENIDNTVLITGTVHAFEGAYKRDSGILFEELVKAATYYSDNNILKNTRLIIAPLCNPDGYYDGKSSTGFGRCTFNGTDINRDFKDYEYKAMESVHLKKLIDKYKPNTYIDIHGWLNSLYGDEKIINSFYNNALIERKYPNQWGVNKGYIMGYTHKNFDCKSALIEFSNPNIISAGRIISSLNEIIFGYENLSEDEKLARNLSKAFSDLRVLDKAFVKKIIRR